MRVRELRWGVSNRGAALIRVFYCVFPICLFSAAAWIGTRELDTSIEIWVTFEMILLASVAPALLANTFTKEYEMGNIDMLRMTLLSPRAIVMGKAASGAISLAPAIAATLVAAVIALLWRPSQVAVLSTGYITLFCCCFLSVSLGVLASLLTRRTTTSLVLGYLMAILAFCGLWLSVILTRLFVGQESASYATESFAALSPIAAFLYLWHPTRESAGNIWMWLGSLVLFGVLAYALLELSVAIFTQFRMRDE
jgi:ABC-type transport system involved in multi-copper enzyme maturation permease subunit